LQFFARLKAHGFAGRNVDLFACTWIAADAGLARLDAENAETPKLNALTAAERIFQRFEHGLDSLLSLGSTKVWRRVDDSIYDFKLDQCASGCRGLLLGVTLQVVKT